jgi:hypothetical protein
VADHVVTTEENLVTKGSAKSDDCRGDAGDGGLPDVGVAVSELDVVHRQAEALCGGLCLRGGGTCPELVGGAVDGMVASTARLSRTTAVTMASGLFAALCHADQPVTVGSRWARRSADQPNASAPSW